MKNYNDLLKKQLLNLKKKITPFSGTLDEIGQLGQPVKIPNNIDYFEPKNAWDKYLTITQTKVNNEGNDSEETSNNGNAAPETGRIGLGRDNTNKVNKLIDIIKKRFAIDNKIKKFQLEKLPVREVTPQTPQYHAVNVPELTGNAKPREDVYTEIRRRNIEAFISPEMEHLARAFFRMPPKAQESVTKLPDVSNMSDREMKEWAFLNAKEYGMSPVDIYAWMLIMKGE